MGEVISMSAAAINAVNSTNGLIPENLKSGAILLGLILAIAIYAIFVWYFYRFVAKRDVLSLDLSKYNNRKFGSLIKIFASLFYLIKFIVIIPLLVIFWFAIFSVLLFILAKDQTTTSIILIAVSVVGAIRIASYFNEDLSKDLAKMIPFTLLGIAIITPGFFDISLTMQKFADVPLLLNNLLIYVIFIISLEIILRLGYSVYSWINPPEKEKPQSHNKV